MKSTRCISLQSVLLAICLIAPQLLEAKTFKVNCIPPPDNRVINACSIAAQQAAGQHAQDTIFNIIAYEFQGNKVIRSENLSKQGILPYSLTVPRKIDRIDFYLQSYDGKYFLWEYPLYLKPQDFEKCTEINLYAATQVQKDHVAGEISAETTPCPDRIEN